MSELREDAIVDFFEKELKNMKFIPPSDHKDIESWLDSLCDNSKKRYEKALTARDIWKFFIKKSLQAITNNHRGYDELCRYFNDYIEYENLLFALDENYRDHAIHSVWVMLLGFYLREKCTAFREIDYYITYKHNHPKAQNDVVETKKIIKKYEKPLWCLIALTHDLGYPIQKTKKANAIMAKMIANFGFLRQRDFDYNFTIVQQPALNELLKILAASIVWTDEGYQIGYQSGVCVDYAKSFERLDHGIMSAYLLLLHLDWICDTMRMIRGVEEPSKDYEKAAQQTMIITLLDAISSHTNKNKYTDNLNTMSSLLFISDELEEFSRYSQSSKKKDWINTKCRTNVRCTKNSIKMEYILDTPDIDDDIESLFREKVNKIYNRFEFKSEKIKKLSIICKDMRTSEEPKLEYVKTASEQFLKIDGKRYNNNTEILEFLSGKSDRLSK